MNEHHKCRRCGHGKEEHHEGGNCLALWCDCPVLSPEDDGPKTDPPPPPAKKGSEGEEFDVHVAPSFPPWY